MKNTLLFFCLLGSLTVFSQSSTLITPNGNIGIFSKNNTPVLSDPGAVQPPASGAGTRLMWIPAKSAFRAGSVEGNQWDAANIGAWSTAMGYNTTAGGYASTALGLSTIASGNSSTALGAATTASGIVSTAIGHNSIASGNWSTALGFENTASQSWSTALGSGTTASGFVSTALGGSTTAGGDYSTALGRTTTAQAYNSLVIGRYNIIAGTAGSWVTTDPLFVIGNGDEFTKNNAVTVLKNGRVGIGTPTPDSPLHITGNLSSTDSVKRAFFNINTGNAIATGEEVSGEIAVHANGYFWADGGGYVATSDARIKNIIGRSNTTDDLEKLRKIAVTDYRYIDEINNGSTLQKKVVAQQVKEIFPIAVNQTKGFIPNVYQTAKKVSLVGHTTQIVTGKAHDFQTGDVVKLVVENEGEKVVEVNVMDSHTFSVAQPFNNKVFVYGKQVNDLHNVDYDAIAMLNVSATQELAKQLDLLKRKNEELEAKVAEMDEFKSQMASLRSLLLKTDNAQERSSVSENKK